MKNFRKFVFLCFVFKTGFFDMWSMLVFNFQFIGLEYTTMLGYNCTILRLKFLLKLVICSYYYKPLKLGYFRLVNKLQLYWH